MDMIYYSERMAFYRNKKKLTPKECFTNAVISKAAWMNMEAGKSLPKATTLMKVCDQLGVSPDLLFQDYDRESCLNATMELYRSLDKAKMLEVNRIISDMTNEG